VKLQAALIIQGQDVPKTKESIALAQKLIEKTDRIIANLSFTRDQFYKNVRNGQLKLSKE
jgi:hypothetical protein